MTNEKLKQAIESKTLDDSIIILLYKNDVAKYIANTYINEICKYKNLEKQYINSITQIPSDNDFLMDSDNVLYVLEVEKLTEYPMDEKNLVIVTKSVPSDIQVDYVEMIEPTTNHILSYVSNRLKGLSEDIIKWLCNVCKYDINRLDNECKKLEKFPAASQNQIFMLMNQDNAYSDLSENNIFNFTNAVLDKKYDLIGELIQELDTADIEPLACVTILLNQFKKKIEFLLNPKATAQSCGMTDKQFYFLKKHPEKYSPFTSDEMIRNIEFLSNIDYQIKSGNLDLSREQLLSYITINVLR